MSHAYRDLIEQEAKRAEDDLAAFRARSLTIVTTSSGIITLLTGVVTFAASRDAEELGLPAAAIALMGTGLALFLAAAVVAMLANASGIVVRPSTPAMEHAMSKEGWVEDDAVEQERQVAAVLVKYVTSVQALADRAAIRLNLAIWLQIAGLGFSSVATFATMVSLSS